MTTTRKTGIDDPMTELLRQHEWVSAGCETVLGPRMLALVDWVDSKVVEFAIKAGASELLVSRLIDRSVLERAGYFESFPASVVEESDGGCIPPATCYHCYAKLAATSLPEPSILTCIARCRRNEGKEESGRLRAFTMREIVFVGSAAWVRERREGWVAPKFSLPPPLPFALHPHTATHFFISSGLTSHLQPPPP